MFDSTVLDVGIGLVFVYLLLSLAASSAREGLEAFLKQRAKDLFRGIKELLGDDANTQAFVAKLYNHGVINALYHGKFDASNPGQLPSYIPSKNFALAILSFWYQIKEDEKNGVLPSVTLPTNVVGALKAFEAAANKDRLRFEKLVEDWYNSAMDRVSGKYKRHTQNWLFAIGLVLSIAVNADTVQIVQRLSTDKTLRGAVVQAAQNEADNDAVRQQVQAELKRRKEEADKKSESPNPPATLASIGSDTQSIAGSASAPATIPADQPPGVKDSINKIKLNLADLDGVGLPLGWKAEYGLWKSSRNIQKATLSTYFNFFFYSALHHSAGWFLTALALSLGAPFWFDMLNKFMVVRSTVKPNEKSGEERSKDGQAPPPPPPVAPPQPVPQPAPPVAPPPLLAVQAPPAGAEIDIRPIQDQQP